MATRSTIGIVNSDETITSIYCHWDGYPEHNGKILVEHYTDEEKVRQLMSLGALSILGAEIGEKQDFDNHNDGWCLAYGRDRGEKNVASTKHHSLFYFLNNGEDYNYLFKDGKWICFNYDKKQIELDFSKEAA